MGGTNGEGFLRPELRQLLSQVPRVNFWQQNAGFSESRLAGKAWASFWCEPSHFPLPLTLYKFLFSLFSDFPYGCGSRVDSGQNRNVANVSLKEVIVP